MKILKRFLYIFWIKKFKIINGLKYFVKERWWRVRVVVNFVVRVFVEICKMLLIFYNVRVVFKILGVLN